MGAVSKDSIKDLMTIPGVGKSIANDLLLLGYSRVTDLINQDPQIMYDKMCEITHSHQDRCLLYVFRCAVYFASNTYYDPELLKWWNWKDKSVK
jgi:hypothetical protein